MGNTRELQKQTSSVILSKTLSPVTVTSTTQSRATCSSLPCVFGCITTVMYIIYLLSFNASSRQSRTSIPTCRVFDVQTDIENRYRVVLIIGYFVR